MVKLLPKLAGIACALTATFGPVGCTPTRAASAEVPKQTPSFAPPDVLIEPTAEPVHPKKSPQDRPALNDSERVVQAVNAWKDSQINKNMAGFLGCYSFPIRFQGTPLTRRELESRESGHFAKHKEVQIATTELEISRSGDKIRTTFDVTYDAVLASGKRIHARGAKAFTFKDTPDGLKIVAEG